MCIYTGLIDWNPPEWLQLAKQVKERHQDGLLPVNINQGNGLAGNAKITMGANGDSYYEYLLKQVGRSPHRVTKRFALPSVKY